MHESSRLKVQMFRDTYLRQLARPVRVLDIGSMAYKEHDSYRSLFGEGFEYVGLDLAEGPNVDLVPADPYCWSEVPTGTFDAVISGQVFEHNPYFWITMAEVARVLSVGGHLCVSAPSRGHVHRYPLDCWRFYPDAASSMCAYVGLDLLESYIEPDEDRIVEGVDWGDFFMVARRPAFDGEQERRLDLIVATRAALPDPATSVGPAIEAYERVVAVPHAVWRWKRSQARGRLALRRALRMGRRVSGALVRRLQGG